MGIEYDPSPLLQQYEHANKLVTSSWLGAKLGSPDIKVLECNADSMLYDIGHIPTSGCIRWDNNLTASTQLDVVSTAEFALLMANLGISPQDTIILYGDQMNSWAFYALWVFELFGHQDVRILDGGRSAWMLEERETSYEVPDPFPSSYPLVDRDDTSTRIFVDELRGKISVASGMHHTQILDLRSAEDFAHAHIPGAINFSSDANFLPNSRIRPRDELIQNHAHLDSSAETILYSNNGAAAAQEWFILKYLLGWTNVRVYDGSWKEWGNMLRLPRETSVLYT